MQRNRIKHFPVLLIIALGFRSERFQKFPRFRYYRSRLTFLKKAVFPQASNDMRRLRDTGSRLLCQVAEFELFRRITQQHSYNSTRLAEESRSYALLGLEVLSGFRYVDVNAVRGEI